jgi:hypothetical protein
MAASDTSVTRFPMLGALAPAIVPMCVSAVMSEPLYSGIAVWKCAPMVAGPNGIPP